MSRTFGCDVSFAQVGLDYGQLAKAGVQFCWVKQLDWASTGYFVDPRYNTHMQGMRGAGAWTGSYAFGHVTPDPLKFADKFASMCPTDELPPVLDMETMRNGAVPPEAGAWSLACLQRLEQQLKLTPVLYTYTGYLSLIIKQAPGLARYPIWIAEYHQPPESDNTPKLPSPIPQDRLIGWQWAGDEGRLPGCQGPIDRDVLVWPLEQVLDLAKAPLSGLPASPSSSPYLAAS